MNATDFKQEYFGLVEAELRYLLVYANLNKEFHDAAAHYIEHGEFGLAFDNIRIGATNVTKEVQALIDILAKYLSI